MKAADILDAIRKEHPKTALVPEISVQVPEYIDENPAGKAYMRRIDALMWNSCQITAIEIKTTRADWLRETRSKVGPWLRLAHRFVYAVPADLDTPQDLPYAHQVGIWEVDPATLRIKVRRPCVVNRHPHPFPPDLIQRLAYKSNYRTPE